MTRGAGRIALPHVDACDVPTFTRPGLNPTAKPGHTLARPGHCLVQKRSDVEAELHPITTQKNIEGVELTP